MATNIEHIVEILSAHPELVGNGRWKIKGADWETLEMLDGQAKPSVAAIEAFRATIAADYLDFREKANAIEETIKEVGLRAFVNALQSVDGLLPSPQGDALQAGIDKVKAKFLAGRS